MSSSERYCRPMVHFVNYKLLKFTVQYYFFTNWRPQIVLENYFPGSDAHSSYSADFDIEDYEATDIEVVLETLFDDDRLQLTEKSLRPIACGQPFILVGTHGSLEYLRSYGFKTFADIWDESYDLIIDPQLRLHAVTDVMRWISTWSAEIREKKMTQAQAIAEYNRKHFFSQEFFDQVVNELKTNLKSAFDELNQCNNYKSWISRWEPQINDPCVLEYLEKVQDDPTYPSLARIKFVLDLARCHLQS